MARTARSKNEYRLRLCTVFIRARNAPVRRGEDSALCVARVTNNHTRDGRQTHARIVDPGIPSWRSFDTHRRP
jgi:hypothetical protein